MLRKFWVYILIFILAQALGALSVWGALWLGIPLHGGASLVVPIVVANVLTCIFFLCVRPDDVTWRSLRSGLQVPARSLTLAYVAAAPAFIVLVNLVQETFLGFLPDFVGDVNIEAIMHNPFGLVTLCLLGPVAEELIFRSGVQGGLQRRYRQGAWNPVLWAALAFAIIHANPAQMPAAFVLGIYLGRAYQQTHSLAAPFAIHVMNNTLAVALALFAPADATLTSLFGGTIAAAAVAVLCGIWAFFCLRNIFFYYNKV